MKTLGYTLTDCYYANANFKGQQKQFVIQDDDQLQNVFIKGFVNGPADDGRFRTFNQIAELTNEDYAGLISISKDHKQINWNTGKYSVYPTGINRKKYNEVKKAESDYIAVLYRNCEPFNKKENAKALRAIKKILKRYLSKKDYENCQRFIYMF